MQYTPEDPVAKILVSIPEYSRALEQVGGNDFLSESWYSALVALFDLVLTAIAENDDDLLRRIYGLADRLLVDADVRIQDACAIEMFDPLSGIGFAKEAEAIRRFMGPNGRAYMENSAR